jgi:glutathione synthase/RimK-type ligase-like ATP-grasp enzyme
LPTTFDWRVGIFDRQPLYACKYHMVPSHWQITKKDDSGKRRYGRTETVPVQQAPRQVISAALRAANLIGDGLYGVDVKQSGRHCDIIEVNDNPNIDAGVEDAFLKGELYTRIMDVFLERIEQTKAGKRIP